MTITKEGLEELKSYIIENIWNEPNKESRTNIRPINLYVRSQVSSIWIDDVQIPLPMPTVSYFIKCVNKNDLPGLRIDSEGWVSGSQILTEYRRMIELVSKNGSVFPKNSFYLAFDISKEIVVIAIEKNTYTKLGVLGEDVYMSTWLDTTVGDELSIVSKYVLNTNDQIEMFGYTTGSTDGDLYINGKLASPINSASIPIGSYTEFITDSDLKMKFRIDLDDNEQNRLYVDKNNLQRQILHIPKALNPDGLVITLNTVRIYARKKTGYLPGILISDATYNHNISQITHGDYGVPRYMIEDAQAILGTDNIYLEVHVNLYENDNNITQDNNYINLLYSLPDNEIIRILSEGETSLPFWKAEELEITPYVKAFYDVPENCNWNYFMSVLGCYHATSILSKTFFSFDLGNTIGEPISIYKGSISEEFAQVILFENGLKLLDEYYTCSEDATSITFTLTGEFIPNQDASYHGRIIEKVNTDRNIKFVSATGIEVMTVSFKPILYLQCNFPSTLIKDMLFEARPTYWEPLNQINAYNSYIDNGNGTYTITFTPLAIDKTFVITENCEDDTISPVYHKYELNSLMADNKQLVFDMVCDDINNIKVPIFKLNKFDVYLNGRKQVQNIDYKLATITHSNKFIAYQICLSSSSYIKTVGENICEVYTNNEYKLFDYTDFAVYENLEVLPIQGSYFNDLSILSINGRLTTDITVVADSIHVNTPMVEYSPGAPYNMNTSISAAANASIEGYIKIEQLQKIEAVQAYISQFESYKLSEVLILPYEYHIYSIYTQALCRAAIRGELLPIPNDPNGINDVVLFSEYQMLKEFDVAYDENVKWDYIDADVMYQDVTTTPNVYALIQIINGFLPTDPIKDNN